MHYTIVRRHPRSYTPHPIHCLTGNFAYYAILPQAAIHQALPWLCHWESPDPWPETRPPGLAPGLLSRLFAAPRARPLDQIDGKVGVAQLRDEVDGNHFPRASSGIADHLMVLTVWNSGAAILVDGVLASWVRHLYPRSKLAAAWAGVPSISASTCYRPGPRISRRRLSQGQSEWPAGSIAGACH
jgi:hypothetical protein